MSRSVYRYNVSLCYLYVSLTVSVVSVKRQEVTETAKSVTETSRTYRNFTMAVLYLPIAEIHGLQSYQGRHPKGVVLLGSTSDRDRQKCGRKEIYV